MNRYFFILKWPDREHGDPMGVDMPNDYAAFDYAQRVIRELKEAGAYEDDIGLTLMVRNGTDKTIFAIPFR
jgi:hypothetical protein